MNKNFTYKNSGVDIDQGNKFVEDIKDVVKSTNRLGSVGGIGGFGALFDIQKLGFKNPMLVSATDGVGTKLNLAIQMNKYDTIGIDLVAMCVNDIIVQGAEPLFFLDYLSVGHLDNQVANNIVKGIVAGCKLANTALIGGETAEMPGLYKKGDFDIAGFCVGAVEKDKILPSNVNEGDLIIGLESSGFHSNGYSLIRHIISHHNIDINQTYEGHKIGDLLIEPTKIYVDVCLELFKSNLINALSHITGGGILENIPRVLSDNLSAEIDISSWKTPISLKWLLEYNSMDNSELYKTFNCGVGMVLIIDPSKQDDVKKILSEFDYNFNIIGKIVKGNKTVII